jgi:hypothetical protein
MLDLLSHLGSWLVAAAIVASPLDEVLLALLIPVFLKVLRKRRNPNPDGIGE